MALDEIYIQEAADRVMIQDMLGRYAFAADYGTGNPGRHCLSRTVYSKFPKFR